MARFAVQADTSHNPEIVAIYSNDIFYYADEYINNNLPENYERSELKQEFDNIIIYIKRHIQKPDINNIDLLDDLFYIFVELCIKCYVIPTLENFAMLVSINPGTFSDWALGEYRRATPKYGESVKKWKSICKGRLVSALTQSKGGDINRIFVAKAVYGMAETAPVPAYANPAMNLDNQALITRLSGHMIESGSDSAE